MPGSQRGPADEANQRAERQAERDLQRLRDLVTRLATETDHDELNAIVEDLRAFLRSQDAETGLRIRNLAERLAEKEETGKPGKQ